MSRSTGASATSIDVPVPLRVDEDHHHQERPVASRRTKIYFVRFRIDATRFNRSTGTRDRAEAQKKAGRIVEAATVAPSRACAPENIDLVDLFGEWLAAEAPAHSELTMNEFERYVTKHFVPEFGTLVRMTEPAIDAFMRKRLGAVSAETVKKELSDLRGFIRWAQRHGYLEGTIAVPSVPRRATGRPSEQQRRIDLSPEQMVGLIEALPIANDAGYPVRDVVTLLWETSLRMSTIERLRSPRHYRSGRDVLSITADIDKSRYARDLPLSDAARDVLDRRVHGEGVIFGVGSMRHSLTRAGVAIGLSEADARLVGSRDIRHAAISNLAGSEGATLAGIGYLAGHKTPAITGKYIHSKEADARRTLEARRTPRSS